MSARRMPFRGAPLTSCTNREASSIENQEDRLESKRTCVQRAKEGTIGELADASELQRPCLLGFRCESAIFDSSESGPTIGLMGAAARRDTLVPRGEKPGEGGKDIESAVADVNPSSCREGGGGGCFTGKILSRQPC